MQLRDLLDSESLSNLRRAKLVLGLLSDPGRIQYALSEYCKDIQADRPRPTLYRRAIPSQRDGEGVRYLITRHDRAVYQTDDIGEAIQYLGTHASNKLYDLHTCGTWMRRKLIGQYLAVRESTQTHSPQYDTESGKFRMRPAVDKTSGEIAKQRSKRRVDIVSKRIVPPEVALRKLLDGESDYDPTTHLRMPTGQQHICPKCGTFDILNDKCPTCNGLTRVQITPLVEVNKYVTTSQIQRAVEQQRAMPTGELPQHLQKHTVSGLSTDDKPVAPPRPRKSAAQWFFDTAMDMKLCPAGVYSDIETKELRLVGA